MASLSSTLRALPWAIRFVRWRMRSVRKGAKRLGAGLAPLEHRLDDLDEFLDWIVDHGITSRQSVEGAVALLRESERYDAFHEIVLDIASRKERLSRLSSTFKPMQRSRYRPVIRALTGFDSRLSKLDDHLSYLVRHPNDVSNRLSSMFSFSSSVKVRERRIRYSFDPSGAILFGDGMEDYNDRIFSMGPRAFKKRIRTFVEDALSASLPQGALDRFSGKVRIDISSVSGQQQSTIIGSGVELTINALSFLEAVFSDEKGVFLELIGATHEHEREPEQHADRILIEVRSSAIKTLEHVWKERSLGQEFAGVLAIERLELPNHTGSFANTGEFASYAQSKVGEGMRSYFASNVGLHVAWTLICDRFGQYRPIGTASIRELSGRRNGDATFKKVLEEMRGTDVNGLFSRYVRACERLTRAPLVSSV